jgi:hypothetical protein
MTEHELHVKLWVCTHEKVGSPHWWGCSTGKYGNYTTVRIFSCSVLTFFKQYAPMNQYLNFDTVLVRDLYENDNVPHQSSYHCITR